MLFKPYIWVSCQVYAFVAYRALYVLCVLSVLSLQAVLSCLPWLSVLLKYVAQYLLWEVLHGLQDLQALFRKKVSVLRCAANGDYRCSDYQCTLMVSRT